MEEEHDRPVDRTFVDIADVSTPASTWRARP